MLFTRSHILSREFPMSDVISQEHLRIYRLWKSFLLPERKGANAQDIVCHFIALNASNLQGTCISLYNRLRYFTKQAFEEYLYKSGNAGRFRGMRREYYIVPCEFFELFFSATFRQREYKIKEKLKLWKISEPEYTDIARQILKTIAHGEKTQFQLEKVIAQKYKRTIKINRGGRSIVSTNFELVLDALLDRWQVIPGVEKWRTQKKRYCLFDRLHQPPRFSMNYDDAEKELALSYIKNYGPVQEEDIAWWCDLTIHRAQRILASLASEVRTTKIANSKNLYYIWHKEISKFTSNHINAGERCHFLGRNDPLLTGYRSREVHINQKYSRYIFSTPFESNPAVMINGEIIGSWNFQDTKYSINLTVNLFQNINAATEDKLCMEIERIGDFIGGEDKTTNVKIIYR